MSDTLREAAQACPVCNGEGRVYRMTPAYEAMATQSSGSFGWTGQTHEWRACRPCSGSGLVQPLATPEPALDRERARRDDEWIRLLSLAIWGFAGEPRRCSRCNCEQSTGLHSPTCPMPDEVIGPAARLVIEQPLATPEPALDVERLARAIGYAWAECMPGQVMVISEGFIAAIARAYEADHE